MFDIRKVQEKVMYEAVRAKSNADVAGEVVYGCEKAAHTENNSDWVKSVMQRLENKFESEDVKEIRMNCQCGYGMNEKLVLVRELMAGAASIEEFTNSEKAKAAGLFCKGCELFLQFDFCPCPMLAEVERLETAAWCQCTTGYSKVLFEQAFACKVDVELLKSIKMGDSVCLMKITPHNPVWQ